jgi:hypothetical protein
MLRCSYDMLELKFRQAIGLKLDLSKITPDSVSPNHFETCLF